MLKIYEGTIDEVSVVILFSGVCKVNAVHIRRIESSRSIPSFFSLSEDMQCTGNLIRLFSGLPSGQPSHTRQRLAVG